MTKSTGEDWLGVPALAKTLGLTVKTLYRILVRAKVKPGELRHLYPPGENGDPPRKR